MYSGLGPLIARMMPRHALTGAARAARPAEAQRTPMAAFLVSACPDAALTVRFAYVSREAGHRLLRVVLAMNRCLHRPSPLPAVAAFAA
jgi:hypothetical protein